MYFVLKMTPDFDPDADLLDRLSALPSYWHTPVERLQAECLAEGSVLSLKKLLFAVRDMPYERPGASADAAQACIAEWRGTCSAKHLAVYIALESLGLRPEMWLASYQIDFNQPYYSDVIRSRAAGLGVYDVHNYLTCQLSKRPVIIDITFPAALGEQGFPVTRSWTGNEDFVLCCVPEQIRQITAIENADYIKREWLQALNSDKKALALREQAIQELMKAAKQVLVKV